MVLIMLLQQLSSLNLVISYREFSSLLLGGHGCLLPALGRLLHLCSLVLSLAVSARERRIRPRTWTHCSSVYCLVLAVRRRERPRLRP